MVIAGLLLGVIVGTVFGYKVGVFAGKRMQVKDKPKKSKPLTFEEMMLQATKMPTGDKELAADVDIDIERQLREADL
jgi:hypothetical protein